MAGESLDQGLVFTDLNDPQIEDAFVLVVDLGDELSDAGDDRPEDDSE